jgi:hypothetical protein
MTHRHRAVTRAAAHTLGTCSSTVLPDLVTRCSQTEVEFCRCRAFRIAGVWIERGADVGTTLPARRVLTLTETAHLLGFSDRTMERIVASGLIRGEKCCFRAFFARWSPKWSPGATSRRPYFCVS